MNLLPPANLTEGREASAWASVADPHAAAAEMSADAAEARAALTPPLTGG